MAIWIYGENSKIITCEYCGTKQTLPKLENDKTTNLYDRANHFIRNNEYDKAEALYEMILNEDSKDAEAYWSLILCKFGVEYVEDPKTHEYIPTCNRTQRTSIFADENYKQALKYASKEQKEIYEEEAGKINNIQKGILEISKKEEPFDVFICYKETDEEGNRTQDSVMAQEIYFALQKEGLKVFFAKITLENKIGESYEPYIYAALNSAKVMLVIGTKKEYFEAPWVKNEWSRYQTLIKNGEEKTIIPCYKEMDAYDLPEEFAYLQAQDMSKIGFAQDLIYGVTKIVNKKTVKKSKKKLAIIGIILAIVIVIGTIILINNNNSANVYKKEIIRQASKIGEVSTFNITVDELKAKLMEKLSDDALIEVKNTFYNNGGDESDVLGIGYFNDIAYTSTDKTDVTGIIIFSTIDGYVTEVHCLNTYVSEEMDYSLPLQLYDETKGILGRENEKWQELIESEKITENTYTYYGEEVTIDEFGSSRMNMEIILKVL